MTKPITIPNTFSTQSGNVPASQIDADFTTCSGAINDLGTYANFGTDTGVANAYVIGFTAGITVSLTQGLPVTFIPANACTNTSSINVGGTGVLPLTRPDGTNTRTGDIVNGLIHEAVYNQSSNTWVLVQQPNFGFTQSLGTSGWERAPSGRILQWATVATTTSGAGVITLTWPIVFPNAAFALFPTMGDNNIAGLTVQVANSTVNPVSAQVVIFQGGSTVNSQSVRVNYQVIGN